jgi:hypothetical protein
LPVSSAGRGPMKPVRAQAPRFRALPGARRRQPSPRPGSVDSPRLRGTLELSGLPGRRQPEVLERLARYLTRAPVGLAKVFPQPDGRVKLLTPPDPKTGLAGRLFDPIDWVHAVTTQIPDPRQHMVRYQGAYANRVRRLYRPGRGEAPGEPAPQASGRADPEEDVPAWVKQRRRSWARLLRRIYEVDPLVCPRCGEELKVVAVITDPVVVDRILAHRRTKKIRSPFEPRAPPAA